MMEVSPHFACRRADGPTDPHRFWQAHLHRQSATKCRKTEEREGKEKNDVRAPFETQRTIARGEGRGSPGAGNAS